MAASILLKGKRLALKKVPDLYDIILCLTCSDISDNRGIQRQHYDDRRPDELSWTRRRKLVRKMRASSLVSDLWSRDAERRSCLARVVRASEAGHRLPSEGTCEDGREID
jgi:UDP-N-acetylglucosamine enolpyruvyl transferase